MGESAQGIPRRIAELEADTKALESIAERLASAARVQGLHGDDVLRYWRAEHAVRSAIGNMLQLQMHLHVDGIMRGTDANHD